jgi:opacity protein-like surface antigen
MNRILGLALLAAALAAAPARAATVSIGAEAFGGMCIPVVQDDADQGTVFGVRVPAHVTPLLTVEPWFAKSALGDKNVDIAGLPYDIDGGEVTGFGLNARLGGLGAPGLSFFPFLGIGSYTLAREGSDDRTEAGYSAGLGLTLSPMPKLGIGLRGEFVMIPTGDTSRKYANATLGLTYTFLSLP